MACIPHIVKCEDTGGPTDLHLKILLEEVLGFAVVATTKTTASSEPCHRGLYGPAIPAESLRGRDSFAGCRVSDASLDKPSPQVGAVISLIGLQLAGLRRRGPAGIGSEVSLSERDKSLAVVDVVTEYAGRQRQTGFPLCRLMANRSARIGCRGVS